MENLDQRIRSKKAQMGGYAKKGNAIRTAKAGRELELLMLEKRIRLATETLGLADDERDRIFQLLSGDEVANNA